MFKLEEFEQLLKAFKECSKEHQEDIMKYEMGSVLNPRKIPVDKPSDNNKV